MEFKKFDTINVIPFIDIMLVLLAIVLTTASFITTGELDIRLPVANSQNSKADREAIVIAINRDGILFLENKEITLSELKQGLQRFSKTTLVTVGVDEDVDFHYFVAVVSLLRELSLDKLSIITRNQE